MHIITKDQQLNEEEKKISSRLIKNLNLMLKIKEKNKLTGKPNVQFNLNTYLLYKLQVSETLLTHTHTPTSLKF